MVLDVDVLRTFRPVVLGSVKRIFEAMVYLASAQSVHRSNVSKGPITCWNRTTLTVTTCGVSDGTVDSHAVDGCESLRVV